MLFVGYVPGPPQEFFPKHASGIKGSDFHMKEHSSWRGRFPSAFRWRLTEKTQCFWKVTFKNNGRINICKFIDEPVVKISDTTPVIYSVSEMLPSKTHGNINIYKFIHQAVVKKSDTTPVIYSVSEHRPSKTHHKTTLWTSWFNTETNYEENKKLTTPFHQLPNFTGFGCQKVENSILIRQTLAYT